MATKEWPRATMKQWEDACTSLSLALAHYVELSNSLLESPCSGDYHSIDPVTRIDPSLQLLQTTIDKQLAESRVTVLKTRNLMVSRIYSFPEEILSEIFTHTIYHRDDLLDRRPGMEARIRRIYQRLHDLLGVCTTWRNVAITWQAFWSLIPIVGPGIGSGLPRFCSTDLSLRRAGLQGLHLAIAHKEHPQCYGDKRFEALEGNFHRFCIVNIDLGSSGDIYRILTKFLQEGAPEKMSQLSLCHSDKSADNPSPPSPLDYFNHASSSVLLQFKRLMVSLSALRISNILFDWEHIAFSNHLVELRIHKVRFTTMSAINSFIKALSSASKLRDLAVIELYYSGSTLPERQILLPELQLLYMEGLSSNALILFLSSLTPGSYHSTLNLTEQTLWDRLGEPETVAADLEDVCNTLQTFPIHKLLLTGHVSEWTSSTALSRLLVSVPALKTLIFNSCDLGKEQLEALCQPQIPDTKFPELHTIEFCAITLSGNGEGFKNLVASHPVRRLVLGGYIWKASIEYWGWEDVPLTEDEEIVQWLKSNVPGFRYLEDPFSTPESINADWELWGL